MRVLSQVSFGTLGNDINSFGIFDMKRVGGEIHRPFSRYVLHEQNSICCFATRKKEFISYRNFACKIISNLRNANRSSWQKANISTITEKFHPSLQSQVERVVFPLLSLSIHSLSTRIFYLVASSSALSASSVI